MNGYNKKLLNPNFLKFRLGCRHDDEISNINHKTRMCQNVLRSGVCQFGANCHYAHTYDELRIMDCAYGNSCIFVNCREDGCTNNNNDDRTKICYFRHPTETDGSYHTRVDGVKVESVEEPEGDKLVPKQVHINPDDSWSTVVSKTLPKHGGDVKPPPPPPSHPNPPVSYNPYSILRNLNENSPIEFSCNDRDHINEYIQECVDNKVSDVSFVLLF
jgi:hypothetical protein